MKRLLSATILIFSVLLTSAYTVRGVVYGPDKRPLEFANIYIKATSTGTSANVEGQYVLNLGAGNHDIVFQHIGYRQQIVSMTISGDTTLDIIMQPLEYEIRDVVINPREDPAIAVIRKAIERRKYFLNAVEDYSCDAYVKGVGKVLKVPKQIFGISIDKAGSRNSPKEGGIFYLSESKSRLYYKKPGKFHEVVYSSKVSGSAGGYTINSAQDFYFNFYDRSITVPFIAERPFIAPLSENAFFFYDFKMLGAYTENGQLINKIQVTPKRRNDPCFTGVLSIIEDTWNIHSLELYLTGNRGLRYVDTLKVTQYFIPVKDDLWLPAQQRFDATGGVLGVKGEGYYIGIFNNYELNNLFGMKPVAKTDSLPAKKAAKQQKRAEKKVVKKIFTPEIIKVENDANKKNITYWDSIRPVPLNKEEAIDYQEKDSLRIIYDSKGYRDTVINKRINRFGRLDLITGYTFRIPSKKLSITFPSLLGFAHYNTVEGYNINLRFRIYKDFKKRRSLLFEPVFRYAFTNRHFNTMAKIEFVNGQLHNEKITLMGGKFISQFNEVQPQPATGNTTGTILFRNNFTKLYEQYFARLDYTREFINGLEGSIGVYYAQRFSLENTSAFSLFFPKKVFTPNGVSLPGITGHDGNISRHNIARLDIGLHITFGRKYVTYPNTRIRIDESNYPELWLSYKKAIPINGISDIDYDLLEIKMAGKIPMKLAGTMFYRVSGGGFASNRVTDYADYRHFYGNFTTITGNDLMGFFLINYYRHSTNRYFAEAHIEHHFNGFFLHKIPGIRKLKIGEVLGFHFLYTPTRQQYFQLDVGIDNIFKLLRVDFVAGFTAHEAPKYGGRIGINLAFLQRQ